MLRPSLAPTPARRPPKRFGRWRGLALAAWTTLSAAAPVFAADPRVQDAPLPERSAAAVREAAAGTKYFGIRIVDEATGRGVPLVALKTSDEVLRYTDSAGWVAYDEPEMMGRDVYFEIASPGYDTTKDGFGFTGVKLRPEPGKAKKVAIRRTQIAQRMYRVTGQGIRRDSILLGGEALPRRDDYQGVTGQDSVQTAPFQGKIFWLWGDTNRAEYPLGNFHTTCALSPLPGEHGFDPAAGIPFDYFQAAPGEVRVREMAPSKQEGPVWLFGLFSIPDAAGAATLVAHFSRHPSLEKVAEHGLMQFDPEAGIFKKILDLPLEEKWRHPQGNAFQAPGDEGEEEYVYFCAPFAHTRVRAAWADVVDPTKYEALSFDAASKKYRWSRDHGPTTQEAERKLLEAGVLPAEQARYRLQSPDGAPVKLHGGSIAWNEYRKKWTMIAVSEGGRESPSYLGEAWYAEAEGNAPTGPWKKAVKIVTHPNYTFYNPRQHPFMQGEGGRIVYFEGTYTKTFSNNRVATPRYEYNQLMYRIDLDDPRLKAAR